MSKFVRYPIQALLYALFALVVGYFSTSPRYHLLKEGEGLLRLSLQHPGKLLVECRQRSAEELAKMPPNMRKAEKCERERSPVSIEVDIDGKTVLAHTSPPSGLSRDGASTLYQRLNVSAGQHQIAVRFKDNQKSEQFTSQIDETVTLKPAQVLVIDYSTDKGGIVLQ